MFSNSIFISYQNRPQATIWKDAPKIQIPESWKKKMGYRRWQDGGAGMCACACGELVWVLCRSTIPRSFRNTCDTSDPRFCTLCFSFFLRHAALCLRDWLVCLTRFLCAFKRFSSWSWWSWWRYTKPVNVSYFSYFSLAQFVALLLHECFFHANHSNHWLTFYCIKKFSLESLNASLWTVNCTLDVVLLWSSNCSGCCLQERNEVFLLIVELLVPKCLVFFHTQSRSFVGRELPCLTYGAFSLLNTCSELGFWGWVFTKISDCFYTCEMGPVYFHKKWIKDISLSSVFQKSIKTLFYTTWLELIFSILGPWLPLAVLS